MIGLLNAELADVSLYACRRDVVERALVFLLELFAQILGGNVARFTIRKVPARLFGELHEPRVRQAHDNSSAIHEELCVHGIAVARGYAVPKVREAAVIRLFGQARGNIEFRDELAHCALIRNSNGGIHGLILRPAQTRARIVWHRLHCAILGSHDLKSTQTEVCATENRAGSKPARYFSWPTATGSALAYELAAAARPAPAGSFMPRSSRIRSSAPRNRSTFPRWLEYPIRPTRQNLVFNSPNPLEISILKSLSRRPRTFGPSMPLGMLTAVTVVRRSAGF